MKHKTFDQIVREHEVELNAIALKHYQTYRHHIGKRPVAIINLLTVQTNKLVDKTRNRINGRSSRVKRRLHALDLLAQMNYYRNNPAAPAPDAPTGPVA